MPEDTRDAILRREAERRIAKNADRTRPEYTSKLCMPESWGWHTHQVNHSKTVVAEVAHSVCDLHAMFRKCVKFEWIGRNDDGIMMWIQHDHAAKSRATPYGDNAFHEHRDGSTLLNLPHPWGNQTYSKVRIWLAHVSDRFSM